MIENCNVGCGMSPTPQWKNFDNSWSVRLARNSLLTAILKNTKLLSSPQLDFINFIKKNKITWANVSKKIPCDNNTMNTVYSSHMLEHLSKNQANSFLLEAKRVLKPGGIIRIAVPDLSIIIDKYLKTKDADQLIDALHMNKEPPQTLIEKIRYLLVGDRHHQWNYDGASLSKLLIQCGFTNPTVLQKGETTISNPGDLDLFERATESLYVEATAPS